MVNSTAGTLAFIGDSLTERGAWEEWFPEFHVVNFGIGGNTSDNALAHRGEVIAAEPDIIVILIGTNDLVWRRAVEHVVRNVESLLAHLRTALPDTQILVQSLLPRSSEFTERLRSINRHLRQYAPAVKAQYLDLWAALSRDGAIIDAEFSDDALHVNEAGYRAWLSELRPALEALRNVPPSSRPITIQRPRDQD